MCPCTRIMALARRRKLETNNPADQSYALHGWLAVIAYSVALILALQCETTLFDHWKKG